MSVNPQYSAQTNFVDFTRSPEFGNPNIQLLHKTNEMQQSQYHTGPPLSCPPLTIEQQQHQQQMQLSGSTNAPIWAQTLTDQITRLSLTVSDIHKRTDKLESIESKMCTIENTLVELSTNVKYAHDRITKVENSCQFISNTFDETNTEINQLKKNVDDLTKTMNIANDDILYLSKSLSDVQTENAKAHNDILYIQHRTMRFNLLFYGVPDGGQNEDTEVVLSTFLEKEIGITEAPVQVTHRLWPFHENQSKPRTIVAHFVRLRDKARILKDAKKLAGKPFGISEQYPKEISERRKQLYPIYKQARRNNRRAFLKVDRLFIDGEEIFPDTVYPRAPSHPASQYSRAPPTASPSHPASTNNTQPPRKRNRHDSTVHNAPVATSNRFSGMPVCDT